MTTIEIPVVAALVGSAIGATTTLGALIFSRWHESRTKQTDFLKIKLEEFFTSLDLIDLQTSIIDIEISPDLDATIQKYFVRTRDLRLAVQKSAMLSRLYFPDCEPRFLRFAGRVEKHSGVMIKFAQTLREESREWEDALNHSIESLMEEMELLKQYIRDEQPTLTKRLFYTGW